MSNPLAATIADPLWDGLLKVYRNRTLRFCGPIVSTNEAYDPSIGPTISCNAAGAMWRLSYRLLGTTPAGWSYGDAVTQYDMSTLAQTALFTGNGGPDNTSSPIYTGISPGTNTNTGTLGSVGVYHFKDVLSIIAELSSGANSFEFEVAPVEPNPIGAVNPQIGLLNTVPLIGTAHPELIFEYGTTRANIASYSRQIDRSQYATTGYIEQPAATDYSGVLTYTNTASEAQRNRFEALIDNGGVEWDVLRQYLVNKAVSIRSYPKQVVSFNPGFGVSPAPFDNYIVGDQVRCRIVVNDATALDAMMRVWGITFDIDANSNENLTLELISP